MPASELAALTPSQSFVIFGADPERYAGGGVSSAGDVNGDGFDALIVGEPRTGYTNSPGEAYVVFGGDFLGGVVFAGDAGVNAFTGTAAPESFIGAAVGTAPARESPACRRA
jgi:hypothetical protein